MSENIDYTDYDGNAGQIEIDERPDTCPICGRGMKPRFLCAYGKGPWYEYSSWLHVCWACSFKDCQKTFISIYKNPYGRRSYGGDSVYLQGSGLLIYRRPKEFKESVVKISPLFEVIYNQSKIAEDNRLDQIVGPGYKKALEFLVKDYLKHIKAESVGKIEEMWLGTAIGKIPSNEVKLCASRAAWLGNDESHYHRAWKDKDIENLKDLIELTVDWIAMNELTIKYEKDMPDGKNKKLKTESKN